MRELTYNEVIELPLGTEVLYKNSRDEYVRCVVDTPLGDGSRDNPIIGKLQGVEKFKDSDVSLIYANVWEREHTRVFIESD